MAAQKGSDVLLKIDTAAVGGPTFSTIGYLQSASLRFGADAVDITNQDSVNKWRELLAGAGIRRMTTSGQGVFNDTVAEVAALTPVLNGTLKQWQAIVPALGTFQGLFQLTQCDYTSRHAGEVQYAMTLESAGPITFTAV